MIPREAPTIRGLAPHVRCIVTPHDSITETDDSWNVDGVNIVIWTQAGPEVCYCRNYQGAGQAANGGGGGAVMMVKDNYIVFSLEDCHEISTEE